jgi:hypothetical protein
MKRGVWVALLDVAVLVALAVVIPCLAPAGEVVPTNGYKVLPAIRQGNLTVFPVVAATPHDTREFLTLDEGLRSAEVVVTESGNVRGLVRGRPRPVVDTGAQVNQLVLVNNSKRPLVLLAGEIITGGKQDRVIGADRIIPPESDPIDLGVFCVEPGRWTGSTMKFGTSGYAPMALPSVRNKAMAAKDQQQVWAEVGRARERVAAGVPGAAPMVSQTTSLAQVMDNDEVKRKLDSVAQPIQHSYVIRQLRNQNAVGVVVAVSGRIVWADLFASTDLLEKYWPKLVRSYAAEAVITRAKGGEPSLSEAQAFLSRMEGRHETVNSEPGVYRHTEISGDGFRAFELTSLLPKTGFDVHVAKMAE